MILPDIRFTSVTPELKRKNFTIRGIIGTLKKPLGSDYLESLLPDNYENLTDHILIKELADSINLNIQATIESNDFSDFKMIRSIFDKIQIWGGIWGGNPYLKAGGINKNLSIQHYVSGIQEIRTGNYVAANKVFREGIKIFNIAFASKHYSFWTSDLQGIKNEGPRQLPILDSLINKLCYNQFNQPNYKDYDQYVEDIYNARLFIKSTQSVDLTIQSLERQLFNYADANPKKSASNPSKPKEKVKSNLPSISNGTFQWGNRTKTYVGIKNNVRGGKVGYIGKDFSLSCSDELKDYLHDPGISWNPNPRFGGSKEKFHVKFNSIEELDRFVKNKMSLNLVDIQEFFKD